MDYASAIFFFLVGFAGMEVFSWAIHKYIMHGPLWSIHKTHHHKHKGFLERNDFFSLFFGLIAVLLIISGLESLDYKFWIGCGITLYGFLYFLLHDLFIHKRIRLLGRSENKYLEAIAKAHRDHHHSNHRDGAVCFGLLWVPGKYFRK